MYATSTTFEVIVYQCFMGDCTGEDGMDTGKGDRMTFQNTHGVLL